MSFKGNTGKTMADATMIVQRLSNGETLTKLQTEYHCAHSTIMRAILSQISKAQWKKIRIRNLRRGGIETRFYKGQRSWNKGRKGVSFPGSEKTQFKKGHLPSNHKHVGTIRLIYRDDRDQGPYREIKVSGIIEGRHKWISYAKYVWEKANGPVPKGSLVFHSNGDRLDDSPENLRLITRRENMAIMKDRNPNWKKKAIKSLKKTCALTRKRKKREKKLEGQEFIKSIVHQQREKEIESTQIAELAKIEGPKISWIECLGCGFEYEKFPKGPCLKCNGLRFTEIKQFASKRTA